MTLFTYPLVNPFVTAVALAVGIADVRATDDARAFSLHARSVRARAFTAAGPKLRTVRVANMPARSAAHNARAISGSTGSTFPPVTPVPEPESQPRRTLCASAQNGCACVRRAYSPVMSGAHQRSAVVQPRGCSSGGVVSVSANGCRNERRLTMKKPVFAVTYVAAGCVRSEKQKNEYDVRAVIAAGEGGGCVPDW